MKPLLVPSILCLALLSACGAPPKPQGVPAEAFFVGKRRDGVFVTIGEPVATGWKVKIHDRAGVLLKEGPFALKGYARGEILPKEVVAWNGTELVLADGSRLVPRP